MQRKTLSAFVAIVCLTFGVSESFAQVGTNGNNTGGAIGGNGGLIGGNTGLIGGGATTANTGNGAGGLRGAVSGLAGGAGGGGATGGGATRQFGGGGGGGAGRGTGGGQVQSARRVIRPTLRIAFEYPIPSEGVSKSLTTQINRIDVRLNNRFKNLSVKTGNKGVVTLSGRVNSENDRKLAAAYVRLEPGVRSIKNDIVVGSIGGTAPLAAPSQTTPSRTRTRQVPAQPAPIRTP